MSGIGGVHVGEGVRHKRQRLRQARRGRSVADHSIGHIFASVRARIAVGIFP